MASSSIPEMNRCEQGSNWSTSPVPLSSWIHISTDGSRDTPLIRTRIAEVLPWPGMEPSSQLCSITATSTRRCRGSVPNGSGPNTSPPPVRSHGHGAGLALEMSTRPTQPSRRPACSWETTSGHTAPRGRRSPEASCSRRSMTWVAVTPYGKSTSNRQPGPSSRTGDGKFSRSPLRRAWLIPGIPSDPSARVITSGVGGCTSDGITARVVIVLPFGRPASANATNSATAASAHTHHGANTTVTTATTISPARASARIVPRALRVSLPCLCRRR